MTTNNGVLGYGKLLQIGNGILGAGANQVETITFGGTPAAGGVAFNLWGLVTALISTASGLPTAVAVQNALNAVFGTAYAAPFLVTLSGNIYTVTANPAGPFANMPLPLITVATNTSLQTVVIAITTPGQTQETFATVGGVITFPDPTMKRDMETYMTFDLINQEYKSKIAKFKDGGDVTLTLVFRNDATQNIVTGLKSLFESGVPYNWRIAVPTRLANSLTTTYGYTEYFTAYLSSFGRIAASADARMVIDAGLAIDGPVAEFPPLL